MAIVGRSGAGKTTIAYLMMRFWDPDRGDILLESQKIDGFRLDDLRGRMALVAQDTYLFNDTVRENIRLGRQDATDAEVEEAARQANAAEFIESFPDGYDTRVGERGMQLSGGQRQRIAIARAILKNAPVLILDEATSHLDAISEATVREALDRLMEGRTTVVIAHRLSTIRDADNILVLDEGQVVEQGTHEQLLARGGLYAQLVATQLTGAAGSHGRRRRGLFDGRQFHRPSLTAASRTRCVNCTIYRTIRPCTPSCEARLSTGGSKGCVTVRGCAASWPGCLQQRMDIFGDVRPVGNGVSEMRIQCGPGYRVYFITRGADLIVLLCGGDKGSQRRDIERAKRMAREWRN